MCVKFHRLPLCLVKQIHINSHTYPSAQSNALSRSLCIHVCVGGCVPVLGKRKKLPFWNRRLCMMPKIKNTRERAPVRLSEKKYMFGGVFPLSTKQHKEQEEVLRIITKKSSRKCACARALLALHMYIYFWINLVWCVRVVENSTAECNIHICIWQ